LKSDFLQLECVLLGFYVATLSCRITTEDISFVPFKFSDPHRAFKYDACVLIICLVMVAGPTERSTLVGLQRGHIMSPCSSSLISLEDLLLDNFFGKPARQTEPTISRPDVAQVRGAT
jgi:hypothetical protein